MKGPVSTSKATRTTNTPSQHSSGGENAVALAPPDYGIEFVDEALKTGVESLTGIDMSDVRIHRHSNEPTRVNALAYAQGSDIHVAPGQEKHLPHEAWHVVQQRQGRVPHASHANTVHIHDDERLEQEADAMGHLAASWNVSGRERSNPQPRRASANGIDSPIQRKAAEALQGASRPVDPGVGEGIDLTFIFTVGPGDIESVRAYIEGMTSYVKNVLRADNVYEITGLEEMFEILEYQSAPGNARVRRIRIVGHGWDGSKHGGEVLTRDVETKSGRSTLVTPAQVCEFAERPRSRGIIRSVMRPGAVVEFWGCNLGKYPKGGEAWADLFQSTFVASKEKVAARELFFELRGSHGTRRARSTREVEQAGAAPTAAFNRFLTSSYTMLVEAGEIAPVSNDPEAILSYMRDLFDRLSGSIPFMAVQEATGRKRIFTPHNLQAWNQAWVLFPVAKEEVSAPAQDQPLLRPATPPPAPAPAAAPPAAAPPPAVPAPVAAPPAAASPPAAAPPAVPPPSVATRPVAKPPKASEPVEAEPPVAAAPSEPAPRGPGPRQPSPATLERQWEAEHREGEVTERGADHLILWNFGVDSAELKPEHAAALDKFAERVQIAFLAAEVRLRIDGHASRSGSVRRNVDLAIGRAGAAFDRLVQRGVSGERCDIDWHDSGEPWFPNMSGATRARNRRVELRIVGRTTTPSALAPRPVPEPPRHRRTPAQPEPELELGEALPGASVEFKREFDPEYPVPFGPYVLCYPSAEISGKYKMKTERNANLALQFGKETKVQFKTKLNELTEFKRDSSGNFGFGFKGDLLKSELIWDWKKLVKKRAPVVYGISRVWSSPDLEYPPGSGVHWSIELEVKGKFALGPSPLALAELGLTAGATGGAAGAAAEGVATGVAALGVAEVATLSGVGLGFALFAFTLYETAHASEVGEQRAHLFGRHVGFALRLAGEVTDDYGYREALGRLRQGTYYEDYYDGWRDAETALAISSTASNERLRRLGEKYGPLAIDPFMEVLLRRAGAYDFKPLPLNLDGLGF